MKIIKECKTEMVEESSCETSFEFCCEQMKRVFSKKWKNSYSDGSGEWNNAFTINDNELMIPVRIEYIEDDITFRLPVKYCPFCGAEIKHEEIKRPKEAVALEIVVKNSGVNLDELAAAISTVPKKKPSKRKHRGN